MNSKKNCSTHYFASSLPLPEKVKTLIQLVKKLAAGEVNKSNTNYAKRTAFDTELTLLKPCLLLSKNESTSEQQFSYLMANPTNTSLVEPCTATQNIATDTSADISTSLAARTQHIPLHSGWVGYYAYPNQIESNEPKEKPQSEFHYYPWTICLDHTTGDFHLLGNPDNQARLLFDLLQQDVTRTLDCAVKDDSERYENTDFKTRQFKASKFSSVWTQKQYNHAFYKIQDYLKAGDCYQVNLTQPHKASYTGSALETLAPLYSALSPSYGCYFEGRDCELISVSPERFISIDASGRLEAKPIKGTIKRSTDPVQDQLYIDELKNSAKNQAENLMIVDLLRNDLSMSAQPNSVKVEKLFELETHPNVHHLVSTISAQLKADLTPTEAIVNAFPGGSITGAPKKRAMEIIDELEAQPRSLYCGSFGYYSNTGNVDFNILIRSVEFRDGEMTCWGGGGITVDSDCEEEYEESLTKVRKIMEVIEGL